MHNKLLCQYRKTEIARRTGPIIVTKTGNRGSIKHPVSGVLLSSVPSAKTQWGMETRHRFEHSQSIPSHPDFQNGNTRVHKGRTKDRRVDNLVRFGRRISAYTSSPSASEIPKIPNSQCGISIPGDSLWASHDPIPIHPYYERGQTIGSNARLDSSCVSGRHAHQSKSFPNVLKPHKQYTKTPSEFGMDYQYCQVRNDPNTEDHLCRLWVRPCPRNSFPSTRENNGPQCPISQYPGIPEHNCKGTNVRIRPFSLNGEISVPRTSPYASNSMVSKGSLERSDASGLYYSSSKTFNTSTKLVASVQTPISSVPSPQSNPADRDFLRCITSGLGCSLQSQNSTGNMGGSLVNKTHQYSRTTGSTVSTKTFPPPNMRENCSNTDRQYYGSVLFDKTGGHTLQRDVSTHPRIATLGRSTWNNNFCKTHQGSEQCTSRCSVTEWSNSERGMVSQPSGFRPTVSSVGETPGGHFCNKLEQQTSTVCISNDGAYGLENRRNVYPLEQHVHLHVSSNDDVEQNNCKIGFRQTQSLSCCSVVANPVMVDRPYFLVNSSSPKTQTGVRFINTTKVGSSVPLSIHAEPTCMVNSAGTSDKHTVDDELAKRIAAPQRESTRRMYNSRVVIFKEWLKSEAITDCTPTIVARFLLHLFHDKKTPSTIEGYKTAITDAFPQMMLRNDTSLLKLIQSFHRDRPRATKHIPSWDLRIVLQFLMGPRFEPMSLASHKNITLKTVFLLALASGSRRSEINAWIAKGVKFGPNYSQVSLTASTAFLAKNQKASLGPKMFQPLVIPSLSQKMSKELPDRTLCPVRALRFYLDLTSKIRGDRTKLFIAFKKGYSAEIKPATISSWLKSTIKLAYESIKPDELKTLSIKAHQVRSLASSWALLGGVSVEDIMTACHWASHTTFTNFYLQPLAWQDADGFSLGPFVAAHHKIFSDS